MTRGRSARKGFAEPSRARAPVAVHNPRGRLSDYLLAKRLG